MKKLFSTVTLFVFMVMQIVNVTAQENMKMKEKETVKMKDGKMMVKKGMMSWEETDKDITTVDGTQIMKNGTVVLKDGTRKTLKEGEEMSFGHKKMKNSKKVVEEKTSRDEKPMPK